ncbi:carbohydrate sulfotransferase 11-like isoform X2 [Panulirus ornatus]
MMWHFGRQLLAVFVLVLAFLLLSLILTSDRSPGLPSISITKEQLRLLQAFAMGEAQENYTRHEQDDPQLLTAKRSEELLAHVRDACKTLDINLPVDSFMMAHMHFDDERKAIYCFVPKVACTSWKRVWMKMTGIVPPDKNISTISRYTVHTRVPLLSTNKERDVKFNTYRKFMFVRHPFDRVLSAFKDKIESEDKASAYNFHKQIGEKIEMKYRGTKAGHGKNVTFSEFIRFISEPGPGSFEQRNEHWLSVHHLCNPCTVQYDFIGKYENLKEDANYVLDWLGARDVIDAFPVSDRPFNARRYDPKYFDQLSYKDKIMFFTKYLADFVAFDYDFV